MPRRRISKVLAVEDAHLTRRRFVLGTIGAGAAVVAAACGGGSEDAAGADAGAGDTTSDPAACTLYPQQTEGPYYLDLDLLRRDITEGREGVPLRLTVRVVRASDCAPLPSVAVDVWHADADGVYSGYAGQQGGLDTTGETFLRGTQVTDDDGSVEFETIYPGWYAGRTTHVHFKVHLSTSSEATSQMYFPEDVTAAVYATPPYDARGQKDTSNAADGVARNDLPPLLTITEGDGEYVATLTVAIAT